VLLRQRQLLADGAPIELGTRAFELLLALLEANGSIVSKQQLLARIWPGIAVAQDNLKMHVFALRRRLAKTATISAPSLAAVTGSLLQSVRLFPGAHIAAHHGSCIGQLGGCFLDGPVGHHCKVGRLIALADILISLEVRPPHSAESRLLWTAIRDARAGGGA
jgi:hypothetical protein